MADRIRVLLLFGGRSAEHDVSRVVGRRRRGRARSDALRGDSGRDHHRGAVAPGRRGARRARGRTRRASRGVHGRGCAGRRGARPGAAGAGGARPRRSARRAGRRRRLRRRAAAAPRSLRRGRHRAGTVRARRRALRRFGRGRLGRRHGQGDDEARVRGRGPPDRRAPRVPRRSRPRRVRGPGGGRAGLPLLREAGEHGLVGRREPRRSTGRRSTSRSTPRSRTTSG